MTNPLPKPQSQEQLPNERGVWISVPEFIRRNKGLIDRNLIYRQINSGKLPAIRIGSKKILIRADALDMLFAQTQSTQDPPQ